MACTHAQKNELCAFAAANETERIRWIWDQQPIPLSPRELKKGQHSESMPLNVEKILAAVH
jgi:hypothetical protein